MISNEEKFIKTSKQLIPFIQRMETTLSIVLKDKGSLSHLSITDEEIECVENTFNLIKDIRERALK